MTGVTGTLLPNGDWDWDFESGGKSLDDDPTGSRVTALRLDPLVEVAVLGVKVLLPPELETGGDF